MVKKIEILNNCFILYTKNSYINMATKKRTRSLCEFKKINDGDLIENNWHNLIEKYSKKQLKKSGVSIIINYILIIIIIVLAAILTIDNNNINNNINNNNNNINDNIVDILNGNINEYIDSNNSRIINAIGFYYDKINIDKNMATYYYRKAININDGSNYKSLFRIGINYKENKNYNDSKKYFNEIIDKYNNYEMEEEYMDVIARSYYQLGQCHLKEMNYDSAIYCFNQGSNRNDVRSMIALAAIYERPEYNYDSYIINLYNKAICDFNHSGAMVSLAKYYKNQKKYDKVEFLLQKAILLNNGDGVYELANFYEYIIGNWSKAQSYYEQAVKFNNIDALYVLCQRDNIDYCHTLTNTGHIGATNYIIDYYSKNNDIINVKKYMKIAEKINLKKYLTEILLLHN